VKRREAGHALGPMPRTMNEGVAEVADLTPSSLHHPSSGFAEPGYSSSETSRVVLHNYRELFTKEAV
jgi:hypothetical protein